MMLFHTKHNNVYVDEPNLDGFMCLLALVFSPLLLCCVMQFMSIHIIILELWKNIPLPVQYELWLMSSKRKCWATKCWWWAPLEPPAEHPEAGFLFDSHYYHVSHNVKKCWTRASSVVEMFTIISLQEVDVFVFLRF